MISIFVEFINQLIDYPINCTSLSTDTIPWAHMTEGVIAPIASYMGMISGLLNITKTCLHNVDPLKPHFYIVKLGFTGVDIIVLISAQNIDCGYLLEPPRRGGSNGYPQSMF